MHGTGRSVEKVEFGHSCVLSNSYVMSRLGAMFKGFMCGKKCIIVVIDVVCVKQRLKMLVYRLHLITAIQSPPEQNQHQAQSIW